jgi:hypothetical protein
MHVYILRARTSTRDIKTITHAYTYPLSARSAAISARYARAFVSCIDRCTGHSFPARNRESVTCTIAVAEIPGRARTAGTRA